jgi:hypothetical protein
MVVDYLNIFGISINPTETNAKLIVNANAMLTGTVPFQQFQMIPRRISQVLHSVRCMNHF